MSKIENFLTTSQEQEIIQAIATAEKNTSGEVRVHIEKETSLESLDRALEVFYLLEMDKTAMRNGVLFYIAVESRKFAILGDKGINDKVSDTFWDEEKELLLSYFKQGNFTQGLVETIHAAGQKLKEFFPYQEDDKDELSNEISKG